MCLIGIRIDEDGGLLVAANRDEFADRPTLPMHWWNEGILAGKDLQAGGTWLGITRTGRFAAVTNVRDPSIKENPVPRASRGHLVTEYLRGATSPDAFINSLANELEAPSPFNLIVGTVDSDRTQLYWFGGRTHEVQLLEPGVHTLSNAEINTPWPKSRSLHQALQDLGHDDAFDSLTDVMRQRRQADDHELPATGVPRDWEKRLSAICITGDRYHTRSTSMIQIRSGSVNARELSWQPDGQLAQDRTETFQI